MGRKILVRAPSPGRRFYRTYYEGTDPRAAVVDEFRLHLKPGELNDKMLLALHIGASVMLGRVPSPEMYAQAKAFAERASHQAEGVKRILDGLKQASQGSATDPSIQSVFVAKGAQTLLVAESQGFEHSTTNTAVNLPPPLPARLSPRMSAPIPVQALSTSIEHQPSVSQQLPQSMEQTAEAGVPASASGGAQAGASAGGSRAAAQAAFAAFGE
jgi:hypothetical protein